MSELIANLGMYDGGPLAEANDALWAAIARRLRALGMRDVPRTLTRDLPLDEVWASERLLFGQICGYPFAAQFRNRLKVVAAPKYSAPGCKKSRHRSFVVVNVRSSARELLALRGLRAVINEEHSMTGRHLFGAAILSAGGARGFFRSVGVSGAHRRSLELVAAGEADVAAIDCVTYAQLARSMPEIVAETRVIHRTIATPTLPFVTARGDAAVAQLARALSEALSDPATADAREALLLDGARPGAETYDEALIVAANADRIFSERVAPPVTPSSVGRARGLGL